MTSQPPIDILKKASSLSLYLGEARKQLLNIIAYIEAIQRDTLFYQLAKQQNLSAAKAAAIAKEMNKWPQEIRIRTERLQHDYQEEKSSLPDDILQALQPPLDTIDLLFSQLLKSDNEKSESPENSLANFEQQIKALLENPSSIQEIKKASQALGFVHETFMRLLREIHKEEKEIWEERLIFEQIEGNYFLEQNKEKIEETIKQLFRKKYVLERYLDTTKYELFLQEKIKVEIWKGHVGNQSRTTLFVNITLEGITDRPSREARLWYDAAKKHFEAVFGERQLVGFVPKEQKRYILAAQMLREFPANFIQYIFNSELMKRKK